MNRSRTFLFPLIVLAGLLLSACGSVPAGSWPGISVDDRGDTIYLAYNQYLYALQADNGAERWRFRPERDNRFQVYAAPELSEDGQLLLGAYNHVLYSLNPDTGNLNWSFAGAANRYIAAPLTSGGAIFAPNADHRLYSLTAEGELRWTFGTDEPQWSPLTSSGDILYLPSMDHRLYAIDAETGQAIWEKDLGGTLVSQPVLSENGTLYVGSMNNEVMAVDSSNGEILWRFATDGPVWGSPALFENQILVGDLEGTLYAIDSDHGQESWRVDGEGAITGSPLVLNDHIYIVHENGNAVAVTMEGNIQWTQKLDAALYGSPMAVGDLILVGLSESESGALLVALDENGNTVWSFVPQK